MQKLRVKVGRTEDKKCIDPRDSRSSSLRRADTPNLQRADQPKVNTETATQPAPVEFPEFEGMANDTSPLAALSAPKKSSTNTTNSEISIKRFVNFVKKAKQQLADCVQTTKKAFSFGWMSSRTGTLVSSLTPIITSPAGLATAWFTGKLVDLVTKHSGSGEISPEVIGVFAGMSAIGILTMIANNASNYYGKKLSIRLSNNTDYFIIDAISKQDITTLESSKFRKDLMQAKAHLWQIGTLMNGVPRIGGDALTLGLSAAAVSLEYWPLAIMLGLAAIPQFTVAIHNGQDTKALEKRLAEPREKKSYTGWLLQNPFDLVPLKMFQKIETLRNRLKKLDKYTLKEEMAVEKKLLRREILAQVISSAANVTTSAYFIYHVIKGNLSVGEWVFLTGAIAAFGSSLNSLGRSIGQQVKNADLIKHAFDVLDDQPETTQKEKYKELKQTKQAPEIEFKNVSFTYPDSDQPVLDDINLKIKPGEFIGIVGESGGGKTTLIKLLAGMYEPTEGQILIDGISLSEIDKDEWYSQLSHMAQNSPLFHSLALGEGIRLGEPNDREGLPIEQATKASGADKVISGLDKGLDTVIGTGFTGGQEFSGGQYQKFSASRAMIRDPLLMILDEPTANLDIAGEVQMAEGIASFNGGIRTRVMISHRFGTLKDADRIIVINDGQIEAIGTHKELMALNGSYAESYRLQKEQYED